MGILGSPGLKNRHESCGLPGQAQLCVKQRKGPGPEPDRRKYYRIPDPGFVREICFPLFFSSFRRVSNSSSTFIFCLSDNRKLFSGHSAGNFFSGHRQFIRSTQGRFFGSAGKSRQGNMIILITRFLQILFYFDFNGNLIIMSLQ